MALFKNYLLLFILLSFIGAAFGQKPVKNDSASNLAIHQLSAYLSLSLSQEQALSALERQRVRSMDSIGRLALSPEQSRFALSNGLQLHFQQVKAVMTGIQWGKYTDMLAKKRAAFLKNASEKKTIVTELPGQNL